MSQRKTPGIPTSSDTLAEMLVSSDLIEKQKNGSPYWEITIPNTAKLVEAIKLVDSSLILPKDEYEQLAISLFSKPTVEVTKPNNAAKPPSKPEVKQTQALENVKVEATPPVVTSIKTTPIVEPIVSKPIEKSKNETAPASIEEPDIFDHLSRETRLLLNAIKSDMLLGKNSHPVWMSARGLVISRNEFESHGISPIKVLDEINANNWLVRDPETQKTLYKTEKDGVKISGYVLNRTIALAIGFKDSNVE